MAEEVTTGGVKKFSYGKNYQPRLGDEQKKEIEKGYAEYYERRKREKRNKMIFWIIIAIIVVLGGAYWILKS